MNIRKALSTDKQYVLKIAERLADFEIPTWRTSEEVASEDIKILDSYFSCPKCNQHLYVAEQDATIVGIIFLEERTDFFNKENLLHISILAVNKAYSGCGIGSKLLGYAEVLSLEQGINRISLNVFASNQHARNLYRKREFNEETISMVKDVG